MYNKGSNCPPPVVKCPSDKTIKWNHRKKENGWSPLKLQDNRANNNSEGTYIII